MVFKTSAVAADLPVAARGAIDMKRKWTALFLMLAFSILWVGCEFPNDDGSFSIAIKNDEKHPVSLTHCRDRACTRKVRTESPISENATAKAFVVTVGEKGWIVVADSEQKRNLGCIPFSFNEQFVNDSVVYSTSQVRPCNETKPIEPVESGKRL